MKNLENDLQVAMENFARSLSDVPLDHGTRSDFHSYLSYFGDSYSSKHAHCRLREVMRAFSWLMNIASYDAACSHRVHIFGMSLPRPTGVFIYR